MRFIMRKGENSEKYKYKEYAITSVFVFCIAIPLLLIKPNESISNLENRKLATLDLSSGVIDKESISQIEAWFEDHVGLRYSFGKANAWLQYNLFGKVIDKNYLVGKKDHLYYMEDEIIKNYQKSNLLNDEELRTVSGNISGFQKFCKVNCNAELFYMMNVDKPEIYPEYLPGSLKTKKGLNRTQQVVNYLNENTEVISLSTQEALLKEKEKSDMLLYYKRFDPSHWTSRGAYIGYLELMKQIQSKFPDIKEVTENEVSFSPKNYESNFYNAISRNEEGYDMVLLNEKNVKMTQEVPEGLQINSKKDFYHYTNEDMQNAPKLLIIGDSYMYSFLLPILSQSFSEVYFVHLSYEIDNMAQILLKIEPDIIVYELIDRSFSMDGINRLSKYANFSPVEFPYEKLPIIEQNPKLTVESMSDLGISGYTQINGWLIDELQQSPVSGLYIRVGDKYYRGSYGSKREDVVYAFGNAKYLNSGFSALIPNQELEKVDEISFIVISSDKSNRYQEFKYKVKINE